MQPESSRAEFSPKPVWLLTFTLTYYSKPEEAAELGTTPNFKWISKSTFILENINWIKKKNSTSVAVISNGAGIP